jgi:hypothetical protein
VQYTYSIEDILFLSDEISSFRLLILRWVIGSGAAIGALDEGLTYMKEVRK